MTPMSLFAQRSDPGVAAVSMPSAAVALRPATVGPMLHLAVSGEDVRVGGPPPQRTAARDSLPLMRARWDELVETARRTVVAAGVAVAAIDRPAFRKAVQPMLDRHLRDADLKRLHDLLRDAA